MMPQDPTSTHEVEAKDLLEDRLPSGQRTILVVDDEPDILSSLKTYLEGCLTGVTVSTASSAEEGFEAVEAMAPDLIISDYKMEGMDGIEFLTECHARMPDVPRILVTAFPDLEVAIDAINEGGVDQFLSKPVDPLNMVSIIYDLLQERHANKERAEAYRRALDLLDSEGRTPGHADA